MEQPVIGIKNPGWNPNDSSDDDEPSPRSSAPQSPMHHLTNSTPTLDYTRLSSRVTKLERDIEFMKTHLKVPMGGSRKTTKRKKKRRSVKSRKGVKR